MDIHDNWLLLDTACPRAVVGVSIGGSIAAETFLGNQKSHAEQLSLGIDECLKDTQLSLKQITGIAVGRGPGSFVGTRVALAHAKGLAAGLAIPLIGVGTLSAFAGDTRLPEGNGLVVTDARREEFFVHKVRRFSPLIQSQSPAHTIAQADLPDILANLDFLIGNGFTLAASPPCPVFYAEGPTAAGLLAALHSRFTTEQCVDELLTLTPDYCRLPDAKPSAFFGSLNSTK